MLRSVICAVLLLIEPSLAAARSATTVDPAKEIVALEYESCPVYLSGDDNRIRGFYADDFTNVGVTGDVLTDSRKIAPSTMKVTACKMDMVSARVHGDAAVAVGRMSLTSSLFSATFRFTDTFVRQGGRWRLLASQQTRVVP